MSDSMFEISFQPGEEVVIRLRAPNLKMMKGETAQHILGAKKEMLMALRSLLDEAISKTENAATPAEEKTRIKVE
jgi:hypothetical protein